MDTSRLTKLLHDDISQLNPCNPTEQAIKDYGKLVSSVAFKFYCKYFITNPAVSFDEVNQVAFLALIEKILPKYDPAKGPIRPYIYYSLIRDLSHFVEYEMRRKSSKYDEYMQFTTIEQEIEDSLSIEEIISFLQQNFSKSSVRIFEMFYLQGFDRNEIAALEDITYDAIQLRLAKITKRLRDWFKEN